MPTNQSPRPQFRDMTTQLAAGECIFCHPGTRPIEDQNELALALRDGYPVTPLHTLIVPRRHIASYFDLAPDELVAMHELLCRQRRALQRLDPAINAFNIGVNAGRDAGQTIFHCHVHLIPRRRGDVANPKGGIRHLIAGKGAY